MGMGTWDRKVTTSVGAAALEVPEALVTTGVPVDSVSQHFQGEGLSVVVDQGPFANPLTSSVGREAYREASEEIGGLPAHTISYDDPDDGTYTVAAHIPALNRLTVVVRANKSVPRRVAEEIIRSIRPTG